MTRSVRPFDWKAAREIVSACGLLDGRMKALLAAYVVLTPLAAAADGASWLMAVSLFASAAPADGGGLAWRWLGRFGVGEADPLRPLLWASAFFVLRAVLAVAVSSIDGLAQAGLRRRVQERCYGNLLRGRWEDLRGGHVGGWVGALTEESSAFSRCVIAVARAGYHAGAAAVLCLIAMAAAPRLFLLVAAVGAPSWFILNRLYAWNASLAARQAAARQRLTADVAERLQGLYQIKAAGDESVHAALGQRQQEELTRVEEGLGHLSGVIGAFNLLLLPAVLVGYAVLAVAEGRPLSAGLSELGGVGILAYRAASQLNQFIAATGTFTRLGGSVAPVHAMALLPSESAREELPEPLAAVSLHAACYRVGSRVIASTGTWTARRGRLVLLTGPSGAGKTTTTNLLAGLLQPSSGEVRYAGESGRVYDARRYRCRAGYVTQDVHLFHGSFRDNLDPARALPEGRLWDALERAGAKTFVAARGGLDAEVAEAGRSLSGGEKRRIAIARALAGRCDFLLLDEVTNGLDEANKAPLLETITRLSRDLVVVAVSHDLAAFDALDKDVVTLCAAETRV